MPLRWHNDIDLEVFAHRALAAARAEALLLHHALRCFSWTVLLTQGEGGPLLAQLAVLNKEQEETFSRINRKLANLIGSGRLAVPEDVEMQDTSAQTGDTAT